ncbi:hypothetical protein SAMN06265348_112225 [Pedobacter westerhofensis]|uniref:Uncharacterized protein n=1 Tax=Pedobacter westerhofensis TaxID=425512 RepID=A0A521FKA2_9SPHI|nr:hypothetical protein SAMN06265348_112225 [Pedobacter westerhofensis]
MPTANVAIELVLQKSKQQFLAIICTFCDNGLKFSGLYFNKN